MKHLTRAQGIAIARSFRDALATRGYPVRRVVLFGSIARNQAHEWSDIDVAVVCTPFRATRHEENMELRRVRRAIDVRISPFCLHLEDFASAFPLAREVERTGVEV